MSKFILVAVAFIGLNYYVFHYVGTESVIPDRSTFDEFPLEAGDWKCRERMDMDAETLHALGVTDYLLCEYDNYETGERVGLYTGYHATQVRKADGSETTIHPPEHCLPGGGWDIIDSRIVPVDFGIPGEAKRFVIAKGNLRSLVYFWYQSRGRVIARNHEKILHMFADRALRGRTDGALVRFTIPILNSDEKTADATFESFARLILPTLPAFVPN